MDWLYYVLYPGSPDALDETITTAVEPAVRVARDRSGVDRWFFLRYADELGTHIRLRFGGEPAALDRLEAALTPSLEAAVACVARPRAASQHVGVFIDFYEPELEKFGGTAGVRIHERVFEASSRLALAAAPQPRSRRIALGARLMLEVAGHLEPRQAPGLWEFTWRFWCGDGVHGAVRRERTRRAGAASTHALRAAAASALDAPGLADAAQAYVSALGDAFAALERAGVPHDRPNLCFHHIHLTNNRLGMAIGEEAWVAAALLSDGASAETPEPAGVHPARR